VKEISVEHVAQMLVLYSDIIKLGKKTFLGLNLQTVYQNATLNANNLTREQLDELIKRYKDFAPDASPTPKVKLSIQKGSAPQRFV
jgi:hypothetical protein